MLFIDHVCPICGGGSIGFRRCGGITKLVLMCDECDAVWLEPTETSAASALFPEGPDFRVPGCTFTVGGTGARWATWDEVAAAGWKEYVKGEGKALDGG